MPLGGGIEKYTEEVGSRLATKGHDIIVFTMRHYGAKSRMYRGMKIRSVPSVALRSFEKMTASLAASLLLIIEPGVDLIHFHAFGPAAFCFIPKLLGRTVVVQGHGIEWKRSRWNAFGRWFLMASEIPSVVFADRLTVVSEVQRRYLKQAYNRDSVVITTGVNPPRKRAPDTIKRQYRLHGKDYILFASRLVREKNAHLLIDAFKGVRTEMKLVVAGDAKHERDYKQSLYNAAKGDKRILFTGFVTGEPLDELFSNAYLFVLPSDVEGLPTVLLEAMSYGVGCIASDIEENLEALGGKGFTFKSGSADSLRRLLQRLVGEPKIVGKAGSEASSYVIKRYSWDAIADRMEAFYMSVLRNRTS